MGAPRIRRAELADSENICRVHKASITALCGGDYTPGQIEAWIGQRQAVDYVKAIQSACFFVAEEDGQIIGFSLMQPAQGVINAVYVHPEHVGRGVGTLLLAALEREARAAGLSRVTLNATLNSVLFYKARGYESCGSGMNTLPSGVELPCLRMEKSMD